ncbi:hypothetical protein M0638_09490 [Roseomonas sp. NAR14]|uniref:Signal transduction histidine kinase dimerisation/phosphoacceptor domain-containing protein n=1 Tax=Roseomonas acroporae TaxID=2937791 RepID=A0A9X1Y613_9PROT|nr:hypothetical protein [Roseomonas acroporae]MCK8784614.1 hypothetical protein [Roseomonas acroporae]
MTRPASQEAEPHAARMRLVASLAPPVQHGLNNLLMVVYANLDALGRSIPEGTSRRQLERIEMAARRLESLTRAILSVSRRGVPDMVSMAPDGVLNGLSPLLELTLSTRLELATSPCPPVRLDRAALEYALLTLAQEAAARLPRQGRLSLVLRNLPEEHAVELCVTELGQPDEGEAAPRAPSVVAALRALALEGDGSLTVEDGPAGRLRLRLPHAPA